MAKKAKPGERATNLSETKDIIRNAVPRIINLVGQRKALNEEIAAEREKVNAAGVSKKALDHAIKIKGMDPEDRQHFDESYAIARDAIGLPQSASLFDFMEASKDDDEDAGDEAPPSGIAALAAAKARLGTDTAPDALSTH
jgi:uncharacterized protein (UPF0335 family)